MYDYMFNEPHHIDYLLLFKHVRANSYAFPRRARDRETTVTGWSGYC
jgi:hypothetical protein